MADVRALILKYGGRKLSQEEIDALAEAAGALPTGESIGRIMKTLADSRRDSMPRGPAKPATRLGDMEL